MTTEVKAPEAAPATETTDLITTVAETYGMTRGVFWNTLRTTIVPRQASDEEVLAFLTVCKEYGLNPFIKEIYCMEGKNGGIIPVVSVDGWLGLINKRPQLDGIEFEIPPRKDWIKIQTSAGDSKWCPPEMTAVIYRKDFAHPVRITEYHDEVYIGPRNKRSGGTFDGPWQTHPKRMLRHKTLMQAARVAFSIGGIYDADEAYRIAAGDRTEDEMFHPADAEVTNVESKARDLAAEIRDEMGPPPSADEEGPNPVDPATATVCLNPLCPALTNNESGVCAICEAAMQNEAGEAAEPDERED